MVGYFNELRAGMNFSMLHLETARVDAVEADDDPAAEDIEKE